MTLPTSPDAAKTAVAAALLGVWGLMLYYQVPHSEDLISFCKYCLVGLASHWLTTYGAADPASSTTITIPKQGVQP